MSLRSVTGKIDGILMAGQLLLTFGIWAAFGFPFIPEFFGFIALVMAAATVWWLMSRWLYRDT